MNDRRFLELLNLYLDHQIEPAEAGELEAAVQSSPARRRIFEEYGQLQRGCSQLGNSARLAAPPAPRFSRSLRLAERKITAPRRSISWYPLQVGAFATLAVAVGFSLVVLTQRSQPAEDGLGPLPRVPKSPQPLAALVTESPAAAPISRVEPFVGVHPTLRALNSNSNFNTDEADAAEPDRDALEWIQRVDQLSLQALVVNEQTFSTKTMLPPEVQAVRRPGYPQTAVEFTGFKLER
jgi:hypothetical protein